MKQIISFCCLFFVGLLHTSVMAATPDVSITDTVTQAMALAADQTILPQAIIWLSSFIGLQFIITNFGLLKSGADIEAIIGKFIGSIAWFSFCFYLLQNGPDFIDSVGNGILTKFAPNLPTPGSVIASTLGLCSSIMLAIAVTGTSVVGTGNSAVANVLVATLFIIFSIGMYMAIKIMMLTLELAIIVMLAPLSFSFLGLNALKDQGIAPLKSLISLVYRIILLGIICASFTKVTKVAGVQLTSINWGSPSQWGVALNVILSILCSFPVIAYLVYKSDSIAASLASGSTSMGPADVASAAAAGAAAGAAVMSGGASVAGAAAKVPQGMGDVLKAMMGGGSISNASGRGMGGQATGEAPRRSASMSMPNANSGTAGAPQRPSATAGSAAQGAGRSASAANVDTAPSRATSSANNLAANQESSVGNAGGGSVEQGGNAGTAGAAASGENAPFGAPATSQGDRATSNVDQAPLRPAAQDEAGQPSGTQNSNAGSKNVDSPPVRPAQTDNSRPPVRPPIESGATAGIAGASSPMEQKVDQVLAALEQQQPKKATFRDKLSDANHHMAQEKAVTTVSINTHHSD